MLNKIPKHNTQSASQNPMRGSLYLPKVDSKDSGATGRIGFYWEDLILNNDKIS